MCRKSRCYGFFAVALASRFSMMIRFDELPDPTMSFIAAGFISRGFGLSGSFGSLGFFGPWLATTFPFRYQRWMMSTNTR